MKETNNQTVEQACPEQVEKKKKGISPFWKGVITTVAVGATIYTVVRYRKEIVSFGKSAVKRGKNLFGGKKKEETVVVNEVIFAQETRPQRTTNNQHQHNKQGWNNPKNNR